MESEGQLQAQRLPTSAAASEVERQSRRLGCEVQLAIFSGLRGQPLSLGLGYSKKFSRHGICCRVSAQVFSVKT
jgi:hypothetical protein